MTIALILLFILCVIILHLIVLRKEITIKPTPEHSAIAERLLNFPVDIVITWVDGKDEKRNKLRELYTIEQNNIAKDAISTRRYLNHNELKYLLRSIDRYIPWVHRIHVISSDQPPPEWLTPNETLGFDFNININEKTANKPVLRWVNDRTILEDNSLPTFNSHALESAIHKLSDLTEHFIYFCDDMFITRSLHPSDLFSECGTPKPCPHYWTSPYRWDQTTHSKTWRKIWSEMSTQFPAKDKWMNDHVCTPLTKQLMKDTEEYWGNDWQLTQCNKFRSGEDIQPIAATIIFGQINDKIIKNNEIISRFIMFQDFYFLNRTRVAFAMSAKPHLLCLNNDLNYPDRFGGQLVHYLDMLWPYQSNWEVT